MTDLRQQLIRLAYENPSLREGLMPILSKTAGKDPAVESYKLIQSYSGLVKAITKEMGKVESTFEGLKKDVDGAAKFSGEHVAALDLMKKSGVPALEAFHEFVGKIVAQSKAATKK